jgi:hypothetical protein
MTDPIILAADAADLAYRIVHIPLIGKRGDVRGYAIVDANDAPWVSQWTWRLHSEGYACRSEGSHDNKRWFFLHRVLLGLTQGDGLEGDHIDRDRLNCRRSNLRIVSKSGNRQNTSSRRGSSSRFRGVHWHKAIGRWGATVRHRHLGWFALEEEAARAAQAARVEVLPYAVD